MAKKPLWQLLVARGYFADRDTATRWIMAGRVLAGEQRIDKAGTLVAEDAEIRVKGWAARYVSRGGYKLEGALADFGLNVQGLVALDAGASTGGFTDCLLQHGARLVYAVDVGYGQLAGKLRVDDRVVNLERTNLSHITAGQLVPRPSLAALDLSYLSLKKAIPHVRGLLTESCEILCLVKPLFEVADQSARRSGKLAPETYAAVLSDLVDYVTQLGLSVRGVTHSHIRGSSGTYEFFLRVCPKPPAAPDLEAEIAAAVRAALSLA